METDRRNPHPEKGAKTDQHEDLLAIYLDRLNRGGKIDPEQLLAEHPGTGEALLKDLEAFIDLAGRDDSPPLGTLGTLGDYTLCRQIGRGGMGVVYEAWQNSVERSVALKVLPAGIAVDERSLQRFVREAKTAAQLDHPNVVGVHGMGLEKDTPYYAMEYVEGETLAQVLGRLKDAEPQTETPFGPQSRQDFYIRLADAFADVADGLQHAHSRGVIHRDVKPSNLILDGERRLRIVDFGLARLEGQDALTLSGDFVGTPLYMSPEQARRRKIPVDHRTDVYSLGATMYEAICGRPPFRGKDHNDTLSQIMEHDPRPPRQWHARIPQALETIVLKCLRKDAGDRYGTAEALGQDLRRFVRGDAIEARAEGRPERVSRFLKRRRKPLAIGFVFLVLLGVVGLLAHRAATVARDQAYDEYRRSVFDLSVWLSSDPFSLRQVRSYRVGGHPDLPRRITKSSLSYITDSDVEKLRSRSRRSVELTAEKLEELAGEFSSEPDGYWQLARAYRLLGRVDSARENALRVLEIDSDFTPAYVLLEELAGQGQERHKSHFPADSWQTRWLAAYELQEKPGAGGRDWARIAAAWDALLELTETREPHLGLHVETLVHSGNAHLLGGEVAKALERSIVVRSLFPSALTPATLAAQSYLKLGQENRAESILKEHFQRLPRERRDEAAFWFAMLYRGYDKEKTLEWAEAIEAPTLRHHVSGYTHWKRKNWDAAAEAARAAISIDSRDMAAHSLLVQTLLDKVSAEQSLACDDYRELLDVAAAARRTDTDEPCSAVLRGIAEATVARALRLAVRGGGAWAAKCLLELGIPIVAPGRRIEEDFGDGAVLDCEPICWREVRQVQCETTADGLLVTAQVGGLVTREVFSGDVTVRVSASWNGTSAIPDATWSVSPHLGIWLHSDVERYQGYAGFLSTDGRVRLKRLPSDDQVLTAQLDWHLSDGANAHGDFELELRAIEHDDGRQHLELRVWRNDETRPVSPQLELVDDTHHVGTVALEVMTTGEPPTPLLIRSVVIEENSD